MLIDIESMDIYNKNENCPDTNKYIYITRNYFAPEFLKKLPIICYEKC